MGKEMELLQKMDLTAENRQKLESLIISENKNLTNGSIGYRL